MVRPDGAVTPWINNKTVFLLPLLRHCMRHIPDPRLTPVRRLPRRLYASRSGYMGTPVRGAARRGRRLPGNRAGALRLYHRQQFRTDPRRAPGRTRSISGRHQTRAGEDFFGNISGIFRPKFTGGRFASFRSGQ
jgi:hypothetical protein